MTEPSPTDDELRAWLDCAERGATSVWLDDDVVSHRTALIRTCRALLAERAEHAVTKARLNKLARAAAHFTTHEARAWGGDIPNDHPMHAVNAIIADYVVNDPDALLEPA